jgi:hypothetical protein
MINITLLGYGFDKGQLFGNTIKIAITFALLVAFFWGSGVFVEDSGRDSSIRWDDGSFFIMSNECEISQGSLTLRLHRYWHSLV